jgi:hypothetical protein
MNALITRRQSRGKCTLASHAGGIGSYGVVTTGGSFQKDELNVKCISPSNRVQRDTFQQAGATILFDPG